MVVVQDQDQDRPLSCRTLQDLRLLVEVRQQRRYRRERTLAVASPADQAGRLGAEFRKCGLDGPE